MNLDENRTNCCYCLKSFKLNYIKCTECRNISLCLTCFSCGAQGGSHKRNHGYSIQMCDLVSKVFENNTWVLDDEMKLLKATELYGIGNWNDIAEKVGSHSADECRDHYITYYIDGVIGKYLLPESTQGKCLVLDHSVTYTDNIETSKLSPSLFDVMPPCNLTAEDQVILGYMPKRDDFERDYDNDAESILCRLKPDFYKDELLDALKVAHVGIYTQRLKERQRRKVIAREHDLISPIMACVLNKRWKPSTSEETLNQDSRNRNTPFTILSPNTLTPNQGKLNRQSRLMTKKVELSPMKKVHVEEIGRNKPYDAFMINESLKPLLRYLTYSQGKALLENLHREQMLKCEISTIIDSVKRGRRRVLDIPFRYPALSTVFVKTRPRALATPAKHQVTSVTADSNHCDDHEDLPATKFSQISPVKKSRKKRKFKSYFFGIRRQR